VVVIAEKIRTYTEYCTDINREQIYTAKSVLLYIDLFFSGDKSTVYTSRTEIYRFI
jgi:hypothetical protein